MLRLSRFFWGVCYNEEQVFAKEGYLIVLFNTDVYQRIFSNYRYSNILLWFTFDTNYWRIFNQTENWTSLVTDDCNDWSSSKERLLSVDIPRGYKLTIHGFTVHISLLILLPRWCIVWNVPKRGI
ncbi:MAG: hypothetical protein IPK61_14795 [Saprospiraceae bacterium]|nr:hypothetical protein [Saprospiraceae bacterium]